MQQPIHHGRPEGEARRRLQASAPYKNADDLSKSAVRFFLIFFYPQRPVAQDRRRK